MQNVLCPASMDAEAVRAGLRTAGFSNLARCLAACTVAVALGGCATVTELFSAPEPVPSSTADAPLPWGTPAGTLTRVEDPSYRLGPEDALEISVWKDDTLKSTAIVRPDGAISFPLVGELQVAGRTATEVREELTRKLSRFVPEAEVTVSVARVVSYRVYVIGRVNRPGDFVVGRPIDVLQALALAGGMTPFAAEDRIRIIRREAGQQRSIPFDYERLRKKGELSQNITLRSGDVLLVP